MGEYLDLSIVLLKLGDSKPCVYVPKEIKIWMIKVDVAIKKASLKNLHNCHSIKLIQNPSFVKNGQEDRGIWSWI